MLHQMINKMGCVTKIMGCSIPYMSCMTDMMGWMIDIMACFTGVMGYITDITGSLTEMIGPIHMTEGRVAIILPCESSTHPCFHAFYFSETRHCLAFSEHMASPAKKILAIMRGGSKVRVLSRHVEEGLGVGMALLQALLSQLDGNLYYVD